MTYSYVVLGCESMYFSQTLQEGKVCYIEKQVCDQLDFLINNVFVTFGGFIYQPQVGIPMGTTFAFPLPDLFSYSYEIEFLQKLIKNKNFNFKTLLTLHKNKLMTYCP